MPGAFKYIRLTKVQVVILKMHLICFKLHSVLTQSVRLFLLYNDLFDFSFYIIIMLIF